MLRHKISPAQVELLKHTRKVNHETAVNALMIRDGIMEFAEEYVDFRDSPGSMAFEERFPKWSQYLDMRRKV